MRKTALVRSVTPLAFALALVTGAASADVVIPSSVYRRGAGGAEFRSDVRIFNPTDAPVNVTPILYDQVSGQTITKPVETIPPRAQKSYDNIVGTLFGKTLDDGAFGPIRFQTTGTVIVSSSVNNYNACGNGSVSGQWLPGLDAGAALASGTLVQLAASADGATGYRSNVVFTNPGTADAIVTSRLRQGDGTLIKEVSVGPLPANGFTQLGGLAAWLPSPNTITSTNLWLEFTSDHPILSFASVINNASGDPFAIVMTAEPNVSTPVLAPVASYTVAPASPGPGQAATFTDTSSHSPTTQLWVFGDGITATSGATVQHTYAAAGTYKTAHFAENSAGASAATKDVVVGTAAPIAVTISATTTGETKWTFICQTGPCNGANNNNVSLKVGQPYTITWTTPAAEAHTHGIGGEVVSFLGISQCDIIRANQPCTVNFTPTSAMLTFLPGGVYPYNCTQTDCAPNMATHNSMTATITIVP